MALDKKAQTTVFFTLMLSISVLVLALALAPIIKSFVDDARAPTSDTQVGLDCSNLSISDWDKATCTLQDLQTPYFFLGIIALAGVIVSAKLLMGG